LVVATLIGGILGASAGLRSPRLYKVSASFVSQEATSSAGGLAGLAGQFGVRIPGASGGESPEFYQELLTSREVLSGVVNRSYDPEPGATNATSVPLLDLAEIGGDTEAERLERGLEWVRGVLTSSISRQTGVVSFSVTTLWPRVSFDMSTALLEAMQEFNLRTRRTQAQSERVFLEARVSAAGDELREAEGRLQAFLQQNRQFQNSPELQFQYERLQREVTMRQEVYTGLVQAYEEAKIREVRDTPVITVLEHPVIPARREARGTVLKGLLGMILGGFLGLGVVFAREMLSGEPTSDGAEFRRAWAETKHDLDRLRFGRRKP
jgi:uncharacterized protein involved in exopolysaccharide biosynthesis